MSGKARTSLLSLAIIVVLVFSAVSPLTVYADEGTPPETTATEVTGNPDEGASTEEGSEAEGSSEETAEETVEAQTTGDSAETESTEDVSTEEGGQTEESSEAPAESQSTEEAAPETSILAEVPENTTVTVLDENGEAQPLATQEAADAIATSDPIWCPSGAAVPKPGESGCTSSFDSFDALLTFLSENGTYQGEGTIYIQQGAYQGNDPDNVVNFNSPSYDLSNINNSSLTVTGGWNPTTGTVDAANPTVFTDYSIIIGSSANPWGGSLFISNINLQASGVPDFNENVNGITLHSDEDINVANVSVTAASGIGAELHAGDDSDDNVNIQNSNFQQNVRGGALVTAGGNVNVANSSFGNPLPDADRWQEFGLDVTTGGSTSLFGVMANMNRQAGVTINSGGPVVIGSSVFSGTKQMWDEDNGETVFLGYGLQVVTPDTIAIDDVTANDNFLWGANLDAGGNISISNSVFNANTTEDPGFIDDTGLFITGGADVALSNVDASDNRLYGAQIEATGSVSITGSTFNNNRGEILDASGATEYHGHGLQITTLADINIRDTTADNNMLFGGELNAAGDVNVAGSSFSNTSTGDAAAAVGNGLEIVSGGNTSLTDVTLDSNQSVGADIQAGGDVFLENVIATNNGTDGVAVQATCAHVFGGTYAGNGQYGLHLVNSALDLAVPPAFSGNVAGDIFPPNPTLCTSPFGSPIEGSASLTSVLGGTSGFANVSLSSFLASSRMGASSQGIFIGKYNYVHTLAGLQIIALDSSSPQVAMAGS